MKDKRVSFDMKPKVKEFYKNDIVYSNTSKESIFIYIVGAIFITYMINTYKRQKYIYIIYDNNCNNYININRISCEIFNERYRPNFKLK